MKFLFGLDVAIFLMEVFLVNQKPDRMEKIKFVTLCLSIFLMFSFLSCNKDASSLVQDDETNADTTVYAGKISIQNSAFNPQEFFVRAKGTVLWTNNDNTVHSVKADNGAFDSGDIQPGADFRHTFNTVGDYTYRCKYHSESGVIKAVIVIK